MKLTIGAFILLCILSYPAQVIAGTIYLNDGRTIEADNLSKGDGWVKTQINGITIEFAIEDIDRIEGLQIKGAGGTPQSRPAGPSKKHGPTGKHSLIKSCYELGYRYGLCAAKRHQNIQCMRKNDIVIPQRCRGKSETEKGLVVGISEISAAPKTPSSPSVPPLSINLASTPLETLQKHLSGKSKQEVTELVGKPHSVKYFAEHELWIYGDSATSSDKAVAFEGENVKAVVLY